MQSTRRVPYIGLQGGGVPAGGTLHAGNAYWQSTITPVTAAPQRYPAPPLPSLYITPIPRDLPSIVARPYKLLKGFNARGTQLEDGFSPVAVVGTPGLGELYADEDMGRTDLERIQGRRIFGMPLPYPRGPSTGSVRHNPVRSDASMSNQQQADDQQMGLTTGMNQLNLKFYETPAGNLENQSETQKSDAKPASVAGSGKTMATTPSSVAPVAPQESFYTDPEDQSKLNRSDVLFNAGTESLPQKLTAARDFNTGKRKGKGKGKDFTTGFK